MKETLNEHKFIDAFKSWDTYKDNFSYEGLKALWQYYTDYEQDTGEELEIDVVATCCEFTEYESLEEAQKDYNVESLEELEDNTTYLPIYNLDGTESERFIIRAY